MEAAINLILYFIMLVVRAMIPLIIFCAEVGIRFVIWLAGVLWELGTQIVSKSVARSTQTPVAPAVVQSIGAVEDAAAMMTAAAAASSPAHNDAS